MTLSSSLSKTIYILCNILVMPAVLIPKFDFFSNLAFIIAFALSFRLNFFILFIVSIVFIFRNNANYRFDLLLKSKGNEIAESDNECVLLYAWCTLLRYFLIGLAANQIFFLFF